MSGARKIMGNTDILPLKLTQPKGRDRYRNKRIVQRVQQWKCKVTVQWMEGLTLPG